MQKMIKYTIRYKIWRVNVFIDARQYLSRNKHKIQI